MFSGKAGDQMSFRAKESGETCQPMPAPLRRQLMETALRSIREGVETGLPFRPKPGDYPEPLRVPRACFVTLSRHHQLRGCIGHLEAVQPLVQDVAENAYAAAFRDTRFPPLGAEELDGLEIHISILTPPIPLPCASEKDLVSQLKPGVDGLILEEGIRHGTFLPSVWDSLPDPGDFVRHLKMKAGLPPAHWSDDIRFYRYGTESFGDEVT